MSAQTEIRGLGVSAGTVVGPVVKVIPPLPVMVPSEEAAPTDVPAAKSDIAAALESVATELERRAGLASGDGAAVLTATAMMARDPSLLTSIGAKLDSGLGPVSSLDAAIREVVAAFTAAGGYLAERATDLLDVRDRAASRLLGQPDPGLPPLLGPSVIVAHDLAPSETAILDPALVLAIVTEAGGPTSHTAILAAQLGIPAVVHAVGVLQIEAGTEVAVDGTSGRVLIAPDESVRAEFGERARVRAELLTQGSGPGRLADGSAVSLYANVGTVADAEHAGAADVEGVGLFRTEFMFLDRASAPTLDEQTASYSTVFSAFGTRPVTIRTLDAGADKPLAFASQDEEENPALGVRGLRLSQRRSDLLSTQLEAIAAAADKTGANARVMAPMVATLDEAEWFAAQCRSAGLRTVGVMIEVPSAALRSRHVLTPVDFASIGTNDLTQYVMAADRLSGELAPLLDAWQPAVLDLVHATTEGAAGKPVGVCGESAGDPLLALVLVGLGVTSLSMAVPKVPAVRLALSLHDRATCVAMAEDARAASGALAARAAAAERAHPDLKALL
jgi:phosphotransferase system enzyme I (PtsI)